MITILYPLLGGLLTASWGAYKDSPYEGFSISSFVRSILVTTLYFLILSRFSVESPTFILLASAACERFTQEICKAFFRFKQRAGIYLIPQGFHILGKEVQSYPRKLIAGTLVFVGFFFLFFKLIPIHIDSYLTRVLVILFFGLTVSAGGAWKDAPIEGFEVSKFPRSLLVTSIVGIFISSYVNSLGILILASLGLERYFVEFYKTFIVRKTPGKFIENIIYPTMVKRRLVFRYTYFIALILLILLIIY